MMADVHLCYKYAIFLVTSLSKRDQGRYSNKNTLATYITTMDPSFFNKSLYDFTVINLEIIAKVVTHSQRY